MTPNLFYRMTVLASVKRRRKEPHRALLVHEVLRKIFEYAAPPQLARGRGKMRNRYILGLALCCRAFCAPALELLWETLFRLSPVLQLLQAKATPHSIWSLLRRSQHQQAIPSPSEYVRQDEERSRIQKYAKLVRHVSLEVDEELDGSQCDHLIALMKERPLFPGLTALHWTTHFATHFSVGFTRLLPLLAVSTLRNVTVNARSAMHRHVYDNLSAFVAALAVHAPCVQTVMYDGLWEDESFQDPLMSYLLCTKSLARVSLNVPSLSTNMMHVTCGLLRLPALKVLSLGPERLWDPPYFHACSSLPGMQGDIRLQLSAYASETASFLEHVPLRSVSSLLLHILGEVQWDACAAVCIRRFSQTLRHLLLSGYSGTGDLSPTAIRLWYPLHRLQSFTCRNYITGIAPVLLSEAELTTLVSAWSSLQYLGLQGLGRVDAPCLITIARLFLHLRTLAVYLDGPDLPIDRALPQPHPLSSMNFSFPYQLYDGPSLVLLAQFILRLFPQATMNLGVEPTRYMTLADRLPDILSWIKSGHRTVLSWDMFLEWDHWRKQSQARPL